MEQTHCLFCMGLLSITSPVTLLANKTNVRSELHGKVSMAAVNCIYVFHETLFERLQKYKNSLNAYFVNNVRNICIAFVTSIFPFLVF